MYKVDPTYVQSLYNSIKSKERDKPLPKTRNIFRKSTEWGQSPVPVAVVAKKRWQIKTGAAVAIEPVKIVTRSRLNTQDTLLRIDNSFYVQRGDKISLPFSDKDMLLRLYRTGHLQIVYPVNRLPSG